MNNQYKLQNTQIANETFALGIDINLVQINNLLIDLFIYSSDYWTRRPNRLTDYLKNMVGEDDGGDKFLPHNSYTLPVYIF